MNGIEFTLKYVPANSFIGRKPAAVLFGNERIEVKKWTDVYRLIYERVNKDPKGHEDLMHLRNKAIGKVRVFVSDVGDGMKRPMKVGDDLYVENCYGVETSFHIMLNCVLRYVRYDISDVKVVVKSR
ncbi:hypothetical protein FACS1894202_11240 [Clostridia bacterium]|nr:hypothetical protein FACS1894202_11240 [Clostridia bacterium]